MVIPHNQPKAQSGFVLADLMVAIAIIGIAVAPLAFSIRSDGRLFRQVYQRSVAMEIVDGEMEILAAGAWEQAPEGTHPYSVNARAVTNLPSGHFVLTKSGHRIRLEWAPTNKHSGKTIVREVTLK